MIFIRALKGLACMTTLAVLVASCGSDPTISPGGGGTGSQVPSTAVGPITGFGSVIINNVRYDDTNANLRTETGAMLSQSDLRLGMTAEVYGSVNNSTRTGTANNIIVFSEIKGFVESMTASNVVVDGTSVSLVSSTVLADFDTLNVGDFIEVYGAFDDNSQSVIATRIERKSPDGFKLRGVVSDWDPDNELFVLNNRAVGYQGVELPNAFANGVSVRVYANAAPSGTSWSATEIRIAQWLSGSSGDRSEIEGVISAYVSQSDFTLNLRSVDATNAVFVDGNPSDLAISRWVEVYGTLRDGRLIAERVEFEDSPGSSSGSDEFDITAQITDFVSTADFHLRGTRIDASAAQEYRDGTAADLANGVCVRIKGDLGWTNQGTTVVATEVRFEDDCN